jgi:hypothetical protein
MLSTRSAPRSYKKYRIGSTRGVELRKGKLRINCSILESTVDKCSAQAAVTRGPERVKIKNLHC